MTRPVPGLTAAEQPEKALLRMVLWAEARGEGPVGVLAVWWVIATRAARQKKSKREIMLARRQFSCLNATDPQGPKMVTADMDDQRGWAMVDAVATLAEAGYTSDPTLGATHYYNPAVASPAWGRGHPQWVETAVIGRHVFGRAA